jgi:hypothetical protein
MTLRMWALAAAALVLVARLSAADSALQSAQAKVDKLVNNQWKRGETVVLTPAEINAWVAAKVPEEIPQGIRETKIELGEDTASASALVDFPKIQQSRGKSVGFAVSMFQGERPLKISVQVASSGGKITVFLTRLELSGVSMEGTALNLLIKAVFMPLYPDAKIGEPVDLDYNIDHIQIRPDALRIYIKK